MGDWQEVALDATLSNSAAGLVKQPGVKGEQQTGKKGGASTQTKIIINIAPKIERQMISRGWDRGSIDVTISNPHRAVIIRDTRHNPNTGTRNNDSATAYINSDGSYVVINDRTGDIVQISNKNDPNWKSPFD